MINCFTLKEKLTKLEDSTCLKSSDIIWVDLFSADEAEKRQVEEVYGVKLFTPQESEEIETSSKYVESEKSIGINLNFLSFENGNYVKSPVSFIIVGKVLITQRNKLYRSFTDTLEKLQTSNTEDGIDVFLTLLETRIDFDADLIESITDQITGIGKHITKTNKLEKKFLLQITSVRESSIIIRESVVEKQRILFTILKSKFFPKEDYDRLAVMNKDVASLLQYSGFNFDRLEFMQNTFLGLVDMEQNRIIKIFTVVTVIFMPPTLIASSYGMNFKFMPELEMAWGYPLAIVLMLSSSLATFLFFKWKKWL